MRRAALTVLATITGLVLLLGFKSHGRPHGGIAALGVASAPPTTSSSGPVSTAPAKAGTTTAATPVPTTPAPKATARTITGQAVDTRYGPVQVDIRVVGSRITQVGVTQVPLDTGRDRAINDDAVPRLDHEALVAQSAHIDSVSGASYTSQGYVTSLQSALDDAGFR